MALLLVACNKQELILEEDADVESSTDLITSLGTKTNTINSTKMTHNAAFSSRFKHSSLVFNNKMWVITGYSGKTENDVWYSENGSSWHKVLTRRMPFTAKYGHASTVFNGKIWLTGGYDEADTEFLWDTNPVWYSNDGINWSQATESANFQTRNDHTLTAFNGALWIIGGHSPDGIGDDEYHSDIWKSTDGSHWEQITNYAAFGMRNEHSVVVFDNKMWLIGGWDWSLSQYKNDVWYSEDGINWVEATGTAAFPSRSEHTVVTDGGYMWLTAGRNADENFNDVWRSSNGVLWVKFHPTRSFPKRRNHSSVFYNDKLWVIGGKNHWYYSDVWSLED